MKIHIVKKGDTLYLIGQKYNVSLEEILKLNPGITNPDVIDVGMKLKIPSGHTGGSGGGMDIMHQHIVKQGDTLWKLSKAWGVPLADMIKANPQLKNPNVLLTGEIVNIPKVSDPMQEVPGGNGTGQGTGGAQFFNPTSIMQGVQGLAGKLSTAPIIGKTPTGPIPGKTPTAPVAPVPAAPVAPVAPVAPAPVAPVQEKKPAAPVAKPTAPIVQPVAPANLPTPKPAPIQPAAKKALPIEKPVEKKLQPYHSEYKPNVDLFKQYGIPATEALSLYDLPKAPESVSPVAQQPMYDGYGYPMGMPAQMGHGYGHPMAMPAQKGYGGWQQPVPFSNMVSPLSEGDDASFECPPGTVFVGSYPSPTTLPLGAGPEWGYGHPMVSPFQYENSHMIEGASAFPNAGMVSPLAAYPNAGMVSPMAAQPNAGMVSPLAAYPNAGMVSPMTAQPNTGMVSPLAAQPNMGMVSPLAMNPNQSMVSPMGMQPEYGYGYGKDMVSPSNVQPDYGYGYGGHGKVSPANIHHDGGYGYGYPAAGFPSYPSYPGWPQTAGVGDSNQADCGCKGNRSDQASAKLADAETPKTVKTAVPRKTGKKAVIRTVTSRPNKAKRANLPWINR